MNGPALAPGSQFPPPKLERQNGAGFREGASRRKAFSCDVYFLRGISMKTKLFTILLFSLSLSLSLFYIMIQPTYADIIVIDTLTDSDTNDSDCSLREAIIAANTNSAYNGCSPGSGTDIIDMTGLSGTIILGSNLPIITGSLQLNGPTTATLTIDGGNTYNAVEGSGSGVTISVDRLAITNVISDGIYATENITVTNSTIIGTDCGVFSLNGGAFVSSSQVTGQNCDGVSVATTAVITGTTISSTVDGVYVDAGNAQVSHSTITAGEDGVDAFEDATVTDSLIEADFDGVYAYTGNILVTRSIITATNNGLHADADIHSGVAEVISSTITSLTDDGIDVDDGMVTVSNSFIYGDEAGIDTDNGDIEVSNSRILGNQVGLDAFGKVTVMSSTVTGNSLAGIQSNANATILYSTIVDSGGDGVIALTANILQSTISGNLGDGVQSSNQTSIIVNHSTIVNNLGYGINNSTGTTVVSHTIIAQNNGMATTRDLNATLSSNSGYNLIGNGDGAGITDGTLGNLVGSTGALLDPKLSLLANHGGDSATRALLPGSLAIDAIPTANCTVTIDQRGVSRPQVNACDIGAFESQGFNLSLTTGDNQQALINTTFAQPLSLQVAANASNEPVGPGGVITFTAPVSGAGLTAIFMTASTDGGGNASVNVTANGVTGNYQVSATATGVSTPLNFNLINYIVITPTTYTLNLTVVGNGMVTPMGGSYLSGTVVPLSATPDAGWQFAGWSGDLSGTTNPADLMMNDDKAITATFSEVASVHKVFLPLLLK